MDRRKMIVTVSASIIGAAASVSTGLAYGNPAFNFPSAKVIAADAVETLSNGSRLYHGHVKLAIYGVELAGTVDRVALDASGIHISVLSSGTKLVARRISGLHVSQVVSK